MKFNLEKKSSKESQQEIKLQMKDQGRRRTQRIGSLTDWIMWKRAHHVTNTR